MSVLMGDVKKGMKKDGNREKNEKGNKIYRVQMQIAYNECGHYVY